MNDQRGIAAAETQLEPKTGPTGIEWWLGYATLIAPALLLLQGKFNQGDGISNSLPAQLVWSTAYLLAASRLVADGISFRALLGRSRTVWAFVMLMLVSTVWSVDPSGTFKESIELVGTTIIACYFVMRYPLPRLLELVNFGYSTIAALSAIVIVLAPGRGRMDFGSGAWCGVYQDKNNLGAAMAMTLIALTASLLSSGRRKLLTCVALALVFALLLGSQSGTALTAGIVSITVGVATLLFRSPRCGLLARALALVLGALGTAGIFFAGFNVDTVFEALGRTSSLTGRTDFWPYLIQAIGDRPVLGYGYRAFFGSPEAANYLSYYAVEAGGWTPYHAHNTFLQICLDAGYLGLAVLVVLLFTAFVRSVGYLATERGAIATWPLMVLLYILAGSYTETYLANFNSVEWILFVAALLYPTRAFADTSPKRGQLPALPASTQVRKGVNSVGA